VAILEFCRKKMKTRFNQKVDVYIESSSDFARPLLQHFRKLVHQVCPAVRERVLWNCPTFYYRGLLCDMAAFEEHCAFGFWKQPFLEEAFPESDEFGKLIRVKSFDDLAHEKLIAYLTFAVRLNEIQTKRKPLKHHGK
jgi:hypothetical protein